MVDSIEEPRGTSRLNGRPAVSLFVQKQSGTNTIEVADGVEAKLAELKRALPADIEIRMTQDQSRFIRRSMEEVNFHLLLAAVLVSLTIMLFIRDWRTTLIATLAIPTSIVPTFMFMSYMDFTLNNITMLGLILAIGIVIDDAVVVHENIFRHMEEYGEDGMTASRRGTSEIMMAVLATSLSLLVIFLPIAFMGGMVGRFFSSFGLTVAFAIVMSLFVSMTLTPMLCSRFLKLEPNHNKGGGSKGGFFWRLVDGGYGAMLRLALRFRWFTMVTCVLVFIATAPIAANLGINLVPRDDQSELQISFITPEGFTLKRTDEVITEIESRLQELPGLVYHYTIIGESSGKGAGDVTRGSIYCRMKELSQRDFSQFDLMAQTRKILKDYPDLRTAVTDVSAIGAKGQDTRLFQMSLKGPDLIKLGEYSETIVNELRKINGLVDVDTTLSLRKPELQVAIDRDRAADLSVPVQSIASTLNILIAGQPISKYKEGNEQYDVWLRGSIGRFASIHNFWKR
ncbi:MAG: efflux RND transporter permease subunit [Pirellulaceae bacterium]